MARNLNLSSSLLRETLSVDVGEKQISTVIVRGGEEVVTPTVNTDRVFDLLDNLNPVPRPATPRLVQQSIPAGTFVAPGTPVDLVFVPPSDITVGIIDGIHRDATTKSISEVLELLDGDVERIVAKGDPSTLTDAERDTVTSALAEKGITVDDSEVDASFDRAYKTLQDLRAFK